jgi:hypothetical protein
MSSRIFAASIVVIGIGAMIPPVETSAGSAPLAAAPMVRPGAPPHVAAPPSARRFVPRGTGAFPRIDGFHRMSRLGDGRGQVFPQWWGYASTFPDYYPPAYAAPEYGAPYGEFPYVSPPYVNFSERSRPIVAHAPECRTDTQKVPSESGGERTINITRCY